jgi:glycosyltransferase involved in cell wall biosynthesis
MTADAVGGVWRYSLDLARALGARGVHVMLAVMGPAPSPAQRREAMRAGVPIIESPYRLEWMDGAEDDVRRAGEWLLILEQALRPDLVHLNGYAHAALPWASPTVVVAHSCVRTWWRAVKGDAAPRRYDGYTRAVLAGLRAARAVVAPTQAMLAGLFDEYNLPLCARVIPNGCEPPARELERSWGWKESLVLAAGRTWDDAKNIASLCSVAPQLTWPVCVAGETCGPNGEGTASDRGVRSLGCLPSRQMRGWYRKASIYALPARYEPFGLSVLEAARAGCALVIGDIPSLRENWEDAALFVPPDDRHALADAIQRLIDHPELRLDLARRAVVRAGGFSIDRTADAYLHLYESVIA